MKLFRLRLERGAETLRRGSLRGRDGGRSSDMVGVALSVKGGEGFLRFRVDVVIGVKNVNNMCLLMVTVVDAKWLVILYRPPCDVRGVIIRQNVPQSNFQRSSRRSICKPS